MGTSPDNTGEKQDSRFKPGQSGNPKGRPKGARSRISESLLGELAEHFETKGKAAIDVVFTERPQDYLKIIASLPNQPWTEPLRSELLGFPAGRHDDQVDALGLVRQLLDSMVYGEAPRPQKPVVRDRYARGDEVREEEEGLSWRTI